MGLIVNRSNTPAGQPDAHTHSGASPKTRLTGEARRTAFLNAAAEMVLEKGPAAVTMDGVAARTGVAKRLGYRYFDNREELLKCLIKREMEEAGRRARAIMSSDPDLHETILVNVTVWLQMVEEHGPLLNRLLFGHDAASAISTDVLEASTKNWTTVLCSFLDLSDTTAEIMARLYLAALRGAVEALERKVAPLEDIATVYTKIALAGADAVSSSTSMSPRPHRKGPSNPTEASHGRREPDR